MAVAPKKSVKAVSKSAAPKAAAKSSKAAPKKAVKSVKKSK